MAFETVCPDRIDMIHKNYRKLCNLLVDVDEWGQVMIINMLTRYARTQFTNPNQEEGGVREGGSEGGSKGGRKKRAFITKQGNRKYPETAFVWHCYFPFPSWLAKFHLPRQYTT